VRKAFKRTSTTIHGPQAGSQRVAGRFRRLSLTTLLMAIAVVAIAAVTVASRQKVKAKEAKTAAVNSPVSSADKQQVNYLKVKVAGQDVLVDPQTGQMKELTPEEAQKMAAGLKQMLNQSTEGLEQVHHADGSVSVDLKGRFQNVTVAKVNKDGSITQSCVDNPKAAGEFFGIDPKLIENAPTGPDQVTPPIQSRP
jgi:hypothetical protein